jgi:hypothetical protein
MSTYMLILRRNQTNELGLPQEEMFGRFRDFTVSLHQSGALKSFERLKAASEGTTTRRLDGAIAVDGPYDGSTESVIGFYLVEAVDVAAAQTIAKDCPILLAGGSVEIRETEFFPGQ